MFTLLLNPTGAHDDMAIDLIFEHCGVIPLWFRDAKSTESIKDVISRSYSWGLPPKIDGAYMGENFTYMYKDDSEEEQDEPLHPYALIENLATGEQLYIYDYGLTLLKNQDGRNADGEMIYKTESYRLD